jgi:FlaG/FlaF family flagellin (archaellin)
MHKSKRAIATLMATILMIGITLVSAFLIYAMVSGWFGGASQIESIDTSKTLVYMDPSTGKGKIILVLRNTGTSSLRIQKIALHCKIDPSTITFDGGTGGKSPQITNGTAVTGTLSGSSSSVSIITQGTTKILYIPPGQSATIELPYTSGMTSLFDIGATYRATIYSAPGAGGITSFTFTIEFG